MKIDIDTLSEKELIELHHKIVERLKFLESMRAHADLLARSGDIMIKRDVPKEPITG